MARKAALKSHRNQLLDMYSRLTGEVNRLVQSVPERVHSAGDLSHVPTHNADRDSEGLENELLLIHNEEQMLQEVEAALRRMDDGSYGHCQQCGEPITEARLKALPYTPWCIDCAQKIHEVQT
jgi:DnaK suppressor protein